MFREDESKYIGLSKIQELIKRPSLEATFNFTESRFENQFSEFAVPWKSKEACTEGEYTFGIQAHIRRAQQIPI